MRSPFLLVPLFVLLLGCPSGSPEVSAALDPAASAAESELLAEIRPDVWVHSTYRQVEGFGHVLSNGLVVVSKEDALLVDTGWGEDPEAETEAILDATHRVSGARVRRAVLTHFHDDSTAGIGWLRREGIPATATSQTADLMEAEGWGRPDALLAGDGVDVWTLPVGERRIEVFYPGPGHTVDNVVVFVPHARVLYGGCLIRPGGSGSLGNTADADIERWAESVARVRARYGERIDLVVPSHGEPRGPELLDHTIALVEAHRASAEKSIGAQRSHREQRSDAAETPEI